MAKKLWEKNTTVNPEIERFTVGRDIEMDLYLAPYDVLGSIAHSAMLQSINLLTEEEMNDLHRELREIYTIAESGNFVIEEGVEANWATQERRYTADVRATTRCL